MRLRRNPTGSANAGSPPPAETVNNPNAPTAELPMHVQLQMNTSNRAEPCPLCGKPWHGEPRINLDGLCRGPWGDDPDAWLPKTHTVEEGDVTWWERNIYGAA